MIIQFCGLSGSGKSTIAGKVKELLLEKNIQVEIIDGDEYRKVLCADLGYSREDRYTNIRRLAFVAGKLSSYNIVTIICAINPYEVIREEVRTQYTGVKTVFIDCSMEVLLERDTKGLYKKAMLPDNHPDKVHNLTGVNDPFDMPGNPDLVIRSDRESAEESAARLMEFILANYAVAL
jgi:adenylylsulfate kinase